MKRILIIEDEPNVAEIMKMLLEKGGYRVECSLDPRKGLGMLKDFDLLLLDIIMPAMSGREVLAEIKKRGINVPIIVVSAVGMPQEVERELSSRYPGISFVPKIRMHEELMEEVKRKIGR